MLVANGPTWFPWALSVFLFGIVAMAVLAVWMIRRDVIARKRREDLTGGDSG
jgi:hypothetical protein